MIEKINKNAIPQIAYKLMEQMFEDGKDWYSSIWVEDTLLEICYDIKPFDKFDDEEYQSGEFIDRWNDTMVEVWEQLMPYIKGWKIDGSGDAYIDYFHDELTDEEKEEYNLDEDGCDKDTWEQYVRCAWCGDLVPISEARFDRDLGYICEYCIEAIESRGEKLHFID